MDLDLLRTYKAIAETGSLMLASRDAPFQLSDLLTVQKFLSVLSGPVGALHARLASEILSRRR